MATYIRQAVVQLPSLTKTGILSYQGPKSARFYSTILSSIMKKTQENLKNLGGGSVDLKTNRENGIAIVTLNNPQQRNAMTGKMMVELADVLTELETWHTGKGVLLCGTNNFYCSGADVQTAEEILNPSDGLALCHFMQTTLTRLYNLPMISVSLVQGKAIGGGAEISTATDFRIMTHDAEIGFVHSKLNCITGWGGGTRLLKLLGKTKGLEILASGRMVKAEEALKLGLANDIIDIHKDVEKTGTNWLRRYTSSTAECTKAIKNLALTSEYEASDSCLLHERGLFSGLWGSAPHKAALAKVLAKSKN